MLTNNKQIIMNFIMEKRQISNFIQKFSQNQNFYFRSSDNQYISFDFPLQIDEVDFFSIKKISEKSKKNKTPSKENFLEIKNVSVFKYESVMKFKALSGRTGITYKNILLCYYFSYHNVKF